MKRTIAVLMAAAMLSLGACVAKDADVTPPTVVADAPVVKITPAATEAACATQGGDWRPICMMQKPACVVSFKDAGKSCKDSAECSGSCQTSGAEPGKPAVGKCTANSDPCGCFQIVDNGVASWPLCAD